MYNFYKEEWSEINSDIKGFLRPYFIVDEEYHFKSTEKFINKYKRYLHKIIPIPWQSIPVFKDGWLLKVHIDNEKKANEENLCAYCGLGFNEKEHCCRWISQNRKIKESKQYTSNRIPSDSNPFHIECMKQARIFCPFMRNLNEEDFEYGEYKILKNNAENHLKEILIKSDNK